MSVTTTIGEEAGAEARVPTRTPVTEKESPTEDESHLVFPTDEVHKISTVATCGFLSGNPDFPITCHAGDECGKDPEHKLVACCKAPINGICVASTRCIDRTMSALADTFGRDLVCEDKRAPLCKTDILQGEPELDGYSFFICDTDKVGEVMLPFTTASRSSVASSLDDQTLTLTSGVDPAGTGSRQPETTSTVDEAASDKPSVGTIVGAVLGSIGGVAAVAAGIMLMRELKKKRGQEQRHRDASSRQQREDASRQNYQLVEIQRGPAELPDSPTSAGGQTASATSPVSPLSPLSPLSMNLVGRSEVSGDNSAAR